ncbi:MAG: carbohydrate kinase [Clostridiales bacterium]|nr:carbohydrate kinase [Clostridiales bacterium]
MIVCIGEILADMIGEEKNGIITYERKAGGAPFNVACALKKFGAEVKFVGNVGDDLIGEFLLKFASDFGMDTTYIGKDDKRNTTLAFVELNEEGERSFCFYRKNTADYYLPEVSDELLSEADIVCIGSLMMATDSCVEYALDVIERAHKLNKLVAFDVNYRTDIFRDTESAVKTYKKILAKADIVKFSEDEVLTFGEDYIEKQLSDKLVLITLGKNGSEWRYKGKRNSQSSIKVNVVDTTGAGDAFFAGALSVLDKLGGEFSFEDLDRAIKFGNITGALNTTGRGAIDNLPSLETVKQYI